MAPAAFAPIDVEQAAEESDSQTSHSRSWKIFAVGGTLLLAAALVFGAKNAGEERPGLAMPPSAGAPSELINENSQPMLHNCFSKELWSDDKKDWCCEQKGLGCTSSYSIKRVSKWKQEQTHKIGGMSRTRLRIIPGAVDVRPKVPLPPGAIDVRPDKA
eukprot:TRINITY_DN931_c0_g5_i3.p1 TRINITY_DN931_c0_g5~~TRINITY_DN931_c0_g5_i3.p1  ORF type:complete len:187 (+),score=35.00 TRINITY_DN931_c0_g5_i3:87-563(+)